MRNIFLSIVLFYSISLFADQNLNQIIATAKSGSKIALPKGIFKGPIIIDKPLILIGSGKDTIIENDNNNTIITIKSSHVSIENLTLRGSGHQRYKLDGGIRADNVQDIKIKNCNFDRTLFGIIFYGIKNSKIINNTMKSYKEEIVDNRGDGILLWGSSNNVIDGNRLFESKDMAISRSNHNIIKNNIIENGRYGLLVNKSENTSVESNKIYSNYVGIRCEGAKNIKIDNNIIAKNRRSSGIGIMLDGGTGIRVTHNTIMDNAQAIYIKSKAAKTGVKRYIEYNKILNNNVAFHFYATIKNNTIKYNNIIGNLEDVTKSVRSVRYCKDNIKENYWDRCMGLDRNKDGISDTPYLVLNYVDKLWQFDPHIKFFYGAPLLCIIDLMEKLAPFTEPNLVFKDTKPETNPISNAGAMSFP